jgi:hypothetical protein
MTVKELQEATKEFDKPIPASKLRPLTRAERAEFERMRRGPGGSIYLRSPKKRAVKVELDVELLRRSNDYASKHKMTLSDVINRSLQTTLVFAE